MQITILPGVAFLVCVGILASQQPKTEKQKVEQPKAIEVSLPFVVYSDKWEQGEIKKCDTYDVPSGLLSCDEAGEWSGALPKIAGELVVTAMHEGRDLDLHEGMTRALMIEMKRGKQFLVTFIPKDGNDYRWPVPRAVAQGGPTTGIQSGKLWSCTRKSDGMSCR